MWECVCEEGREGGSECESEGVWVCGSVGESEGVWICERGCVGGSEGVRKGASVGGRMK